MDTKQITDLVEFARSHTNLTSARTFLAQSANGTLTEGTTRALINIKSAVERGSIPRTAHSPIVTEHAPESVVEPPKVNPWAGIYTIETSHGHRTFKVRSNPEDSDFAPGKTVLSFLNGSDNDNDYKGFAFLVDGGAQIWKRFAGNSSLAADTAQFLANPDGALVAKLCARCGHTLTTPGSIAAGYGPDCVKYKMGSR